MPTKPKGKKKQQYQKSVSVAKPGLARLKSKLDRVVKVRKDRKKIKEIFHLEDEVDTGGAAAVARAERGVARVERRMARAPRRAMFHPPPVTV